jgi:VanZ family protein
MKVKNLLPQQLNENKPINKILSWLAVILWMGLIFYLSSQVADQSARLSSGITEFFIRMITAVFPKIHIDMEYLGFAIRKLAHFLSYLVLGILVLNAFGKCGVHGYKRILFSAIVCILYAASDEIHQLYVPGRGGQIRDVLIDSSGAGTGFILYSITRKFSLLKKESKTEILPGNPDSD